MADRFQMDDISALGAAAAVDPSRLADGAAVMSVATDLLESECEAHCTFPPPGM